ncbi:MAG: BON domain-containing protein [Planctomycetota bacterium]
MRTYLAAVTIAALIALGLESNGLAQQSQDRNGTPSSQTIESLAQQTLSNFNASTSATGGGGGSGSQSGQESSMFSGLGEMSRMPDLQSGDFVGASVEDARAAMAATGAQRAGAGGPSQFGPSGGSGFGQDRFGGRGSQFRGSGAGTRRSRGEIRAKIRLGFSVPRPNPAQLALKSSNLATQLEKSSWLQTQSPVEVSIESGTAILRGVVATDHDRRLAERMARLQPGIRQVENQLTVTPPAESPAMQ